MQITETERLMLIKNKESICGATIEILELENDPKNSLLLKKKISVILALLSQIACYSQQDKNSDLTRITLFANAIFDILSSYSLHPEIFEKTVTDSWQRIVMNRLEHFCNTVNSIKFDFNDKNRIKVTIPKINLNFGNIINQ